MGSLCPRAAPDEQSVDPESALSRSPQRGSDHPSDRLDAIHDDQTEDSFAKLEIDQSLFEIDFDELDIKRSIGAGGSDAVSQNVFTDPFKTNHLFQVIFVAEWHENLVAFKAFKLHDFLSQEKFRDFEKEVAILGSISHPNLVAFYGASIKAPRVGILMEFCPNGDLMDFLKAHPDLAMPERVRILRECASGMKYLHSKNIMHRDLKPQNVLLDESFHAKLIDFGLSRTEDATGALKTQRVGTSHYMAPEIATTGDYDFRVDIFSYSIMAFEILNQTFSPFGKDQTEFGIEIRIASDSAFRPNWETVVPDEPGCEKFVVPEEVKRIVSLGWDHSPECRPSFEQILAVLKGELESSVVEQALSKLRSERKSVAPLMRKTGGEGEVEGEEEGGEVELPLFGLEEIVFDRVPRTVEEFADLREVYHTRIEEDDSVPVQVRRYRKAALGVAFYALSLLVYVREGEAVGIQCISLCCAKEMLIVGSQELANKFHRYFTPLKKFPYLAMSYVFPPPGPSVVVDPPNPENDYAFDLDSSSFAFRVIPGDDAYGGMDVLPMDPIRQCLRLGCCTFKKTGTEGAVQRWFKCMTCRELAVGSSRGCCEVCADVCHRSRGHTVVEADRSPVRAWCDCGEGAAPMHDGDGKLIQCSFRKFGLREALMKFLESEKLSARPFPFGLRLMCSGTVNPKSVRAMPFESEEKDTKYVVKDPLLLDRDIQMPRLPTFETSVAPEPQKVPFEKVPSSLDEFLSLRSEMDKGLHDEEEEKEVLQYRRACLGAAFYALSLLVYTLKGPEVGIPCIRSCCHEEMLARGEDHLDPRYDVVLDRMKQCPYLAASYVRPPGASEVPAPCPENQYEYDFERGFCYDVQPTKAAHGGKLTMMERGHILQRIMKLRCCSYHITGTHIAAQRFFHCLTCQDMVGGHGVCYFCAHQCHASIGHEIVEHDVSPLPCYCDCGHLKEMTESASGKPVHCRMVDRTLEKCQAEYFRQNENEETVFPYGLAIHCNGSDTPASLKLFYVAESDTWVVKRMLLLQPERIAAPKLKLSSPDDEFPELLSQPEPAHLLVLPQYATKILRVSSEHTAMSTAEQMLGPPKVYPSIGNESFDGTWCPDVASKCEFVECEFARASLVKQIRIYQTLKPGALTAVYVRRCLWGGAPVGHWIRMYAADAGPGVDVRILSVKVPEARIPMVTRSVRLELDTTVLGNYSEIDAIELIGHVSCAETPSEALGDPCPLIMPVESIVRASSYYARGYESSRVVGKVVTDASSCWWSNSSTTDETGGHVVVTSHSYKVYPRRVDIGWPASSFSYGYTVVPLVRVLCLVDDDEWIVGWEGAAGPKGEHQITLSGSCTQTPTKCLKLVFGAEGHAVMQKIVLVGIPAFDQGDANSEEKEGEEEGEYEPVDKQLIHSIHSVSSNFGDAWTASNIVGKMTLGTAAWWSGAIAEEEPFIAVIYRRLVYPRQIEIAWCSVHPRYPFVPLLRAEILQGGEWVTACKGPDVAEGDHILRVDRQCRDVLTRGVKLCFAPTNGSNFAAMKKIVLVGVLAPLEIEEALLAEGIPVATVVPAAEKEDDAPEEVDDLAAAAVVVETPDGASLILQAAKLVVSVSSTYSSGWSEDNVVGKMEPTSRGWWSSTVKEATPYIEVAYDVAVLPIRVELAWPSTAWASYPRLPLCRVFVQSLADESMILVFSGEIEPEGSHSIPVDPKLQTVRTDRVRLEYAPNMDGKYAVMEKIVLVGKLKK